MCVQDVSEYHSTLKAVCDAYSPDFYSKHKAISDEYFKIKHRGYNLPI